MTAQSGERGSRGSRIVLTTVGSLGDLHPYLAIAQELQRRGHRPVVATTPGFQDRVEAAGVPFAPLRAMTTESPSPELIRRVFNGRRGMEYLLRKLILPALPMAYADTVAAAEGADLLVAHPLTWSTRFVAEARGTPWVSTVLAPSSLLSATDPPLLPGLEWVYRWKPRPAVWRMLFRLADLGTRRWMRPYHALRTRLRLNDSGHPMFAGGHAPLRELALFSPLFGPPQGDWPGQTMATGFVFFAQFQEATPHLDRWLEAGTPPVIFTLGSSAVQAPGPFFEESVKAARQLGRRALLVGARPGEVAVVPGQDVFFLAYGSYATLFPRGAAVVHQGGVGTTAEALRAGVPMLVVPFGVDQMDNAARAVRLGVAEVLKLRSYRAKAVAGLLRTLLEVPAFADTGHRTGAAIRAEDGVATACDALEAMLG